MGIEIRSAGRFPAVEKIGGDASSYSRRFHTYFLMTIPDIFTTVKLKINWPKFGDFRCWGR